MHLLSQYKYLKPQTHFQNDPKQPLHNLGRFHGNQNKSYSNSKFFYIIRKLIQKEAKNITTVNVENDMVTIYRCFYYCQYYIFLIINPIVHTIVHPLSGFFLITFEILMILSWNFLRFNINLLHTCVENFRPIHCLLFKLYSIIEQVLENSGKKHCIMGIKQKYHNFW